MEDSANLPEPDLLAQEISDDLETALDQFRLIGEQMEKKNTKPNGEIDKK